MNPAIKKYFSKIGSKGGKAKSEAKAAAARLNAKKPRKKHSTSREKRKVK